MSAANNIHSLLAYLLPRQVVCLSAAGRARPRRFAGVGTPSQKALLVTRLDQASDMQTIYADLRRQAVNGSVAALNDLGWIWLNGKYWQADTALAARLLRMAAVQGSAAAWFNLGQQHYFGKGVERSYRWAEHCYRQAFERGMRNAAAALGDLYEEEVCDGELDWRLDPLKACTWFERGAECGDARCRFEIGYRLLHGLCGTGNGTAGVHWLELAAADGLVQAAEELAVHFSGRDAERYLHWRDRALQLGSALVTTSALDDRC